MPAVEPTLTPHLDALEARAVLGGGFAPDAGRKVAARPDATAWAILALQAAGRGRRPIEASRKWLVSRQSRDGRISLSKDHRAAAWPTPLAILAWHGSPDHASAQRRAVRFMLAFRGLALLPTPLLGHDPTLVGWPWIEATHSWVEPTALGLMALLVTGNGGHARALEAGTLLLDRQLPEGGWNYGNTTAFGQVQRPTPDSTGVAMSALGEISDEASPSAATPERVALSLRYLEREVERVRSPLSLAWCLLGLGAWGRRPEPAAAWCLESLERQATLGSYDTALLAAVLFAAHAPAGLVGSLRGGPSG